MHTRKLFFVTVLFSIIALFNPFISCKKDSLLTKGGDLSFSTDTLKFDTVFTSLGSVTRSFKIYNNNNKRIRMSTIKLSGGDSSYFRMNIDGVATKNIQNVELAPNDSLYVFVALTIDPTNGTLPFIIEDRVMITLNGQTSNVELQAYGQDAHYLNDSVLKTSQTWINDKPYVILGPGALIDSDKVLTIQAGCRIYMHATAKLYVKGTLKTFGTLTDSVIFQGDRLDRDYFGYRDYPGEWGGLHFLSSSKQSNLNYTVIKNAGLYDAAVYVQPPWVDLGGPIVEFNSCTIANSAGYGLLCFNTNVRANNCLIQTCGLQNLAIIEGGDYEFNYCTIATYGGVGINHAQQPTVAVLNYRDISLTEYVAADLNALFRNCIIYGSLDDELFLNQKGNSAYNVKMENCLYRKTSAINNAVLINCISNEDPQFEDINKWDYHVKNTSPANNAGKQIALYPIDMEGNVRDPSTPTIGCYEVQ